MVAREQQEKLKNETSEQLKLFPGFWVELRRAVLKARTQSSCTLTMLQHLIVAIRLTRRRTSRHYKQTQIN